MTRPLNIVWICMDQHPLANRPDCAQNLSLQARMAREGTRFSQAFTVLPICSPARASMLTGLYPSSHGLTENDGRFGGRAGLDASDWMIHRPFVDAGYRAAWFGKWHLDNLSGAAAFGLNGVSLPGYGYPYGSEGYRAYLAKWSLEPPVATVELPGESGAPPGTRWRLTERADWPDFEAGTALLDGEAAAHEAFFVANMAYEWIAEAADHPFFVRIDPWGPHPPYLVAPPFQGAFANAGDLRPANFWSDLEHRPPHHRDYRDEWAVVLGLDDAGWRLLAQRSMEQAALVEHALCGVLDTLDRAGLAEQTLVVVCADHGDAVASNGGVANKGGLMVEETLRIPLLIRGPGIAAGQTDDEIATNLDIAPTLLEAAGLARPDGLQGHSLWTPPGSDATRMRKGAMLQHYGLHVPLMQRAWRDKCWKLVLQEDGFCELYDMRADPAELCNLAGEPALAGVRAELICNLAYEIQRVGDTGARQLHLIAKAQSA